MNFIAPSLVLAVLATLAVSADAQVFDAVETADGETTVWDVFLDLSTDSSTSTVVGVALGLAVTGDTSNLEFELDSGFEDAVGPHAPNSLQAVSGGVTFALYALQPGASTLMTGERTRILRVRGVLEGESVEVSDLLGDPPVRSAVMCIDESGEMREHRHVPMTGSSGLSTDAATPALGLTSGEIERRGNGEGEGEGGGGMPPGETLGTDGATLGFCASPIDKSLSIDAIPPWAIVGDPTCSAPNRCFDEIQAALDEILITPAAQLPPQLDIRVFPKEDALGNPQAYQPIEITSQHFAVVDTLRIYSMAAPSFEFNDPMAAAWEQFDMVQYDGKAVIAGDPDVDPKPVVVIRDVPDMKRMQLGTLVGPYEFGDNSNQRGFLIGLGGRDFTGLGGGGVRIIDCEGEVRVYGNVIAGSGREYNDSMVAGGLALTPQQGGGIYVSDCGNVDIVQNEIAYNLIEPVVAVSDGQSTPTYTCSDAEGGGAGIYSTRADVRIVRNFIHRNGFVSNIPGPATTVCGFFAVDDVPREGGGVAIFGGFLSEIPEATSSAVLCGNRLEANNAMEGAGVWVRNGFRLAGIGQVSGPCFPEEPGDCEANSSLEILEGLLVTDNEFDANSAWEPSMVAEFPPLRDFAGGGFALIHNNPLIPNVFTQVEFEIWNNRFLRNDMEPDTFFWLSAALTPSGRVGGAAYLVAGPRIGQGSVWEFHGNALWENRSILEGGGVWAFSEDEDLQSRLVFGNNTIVDNVTFSGNGAGIYVAPGSLQTALACVIDSNQSTNPTISPDWFVGCPQGGGTTDDQWTNCLTVPDMGTFGIGMTADCVDDSNLVERFNAFAPSSTSTDPTIMMGTPPLLLSSLVAGAEPRIGPEASPPVDRGGGVVSLPFDFDRQPRVFDVFPTTPMAPAADLIDTGADELNTFEFLRGDANQDGVYTLSDVLELNAQLQSGSFTVCADALDANDMDGVTTADINYLFQALFGGGPPPPPPFITCGVDLTPESTMSVLCEFDFNACP